MKTLDQLRSYDIVNAPVTTDFVLKSVNNTRQQNAIAAKIGYSTTTRRCT